MDNKKLEGEYILTKLELIPGAMEALKNVHEETGAIFEILPQGIKKLNKDMVKRDPSYVQTVVPGLVIRKVE